MSKFILTCTSTVDMTLEYLEKRDIPFISFHYEIDNEEYLDDLGQSMPFEEFYKKIDEGSMPLTSLPSIGEYIVFFEKFLKEGKDILHISLSSGLSGSHNSACLAKDELFDTYPERKIMVVDSLGASSGYGLLTDLAADMRDEGKDIEQIYDWLEENKLNMHHWFFSTDLTHYKRGGRISSTSSFVGNLLNINPLLNMNSSGELIPREKIRGKKKVISEIVHKMEVHAQNNLNYSGKCFISHSACYDDAKKVADLVGETFPNLNGKIMINSVGTVIGSHTGPGTVALFFLGDKRENDLVKK